MKLASDIMQRTVYALSPDATVEEASRLLAEKSIGGAPVVDSDQKVLGVVNEKDLIVKEMKLHYPTYIHLLSGILSLGTRHFEEELKKAVAATVADVMDANAPTISEDTPLEEIATVMVDGNVERLPVVREGKLVGIVARHDLIRSQAKS